MFRIKTLGIIHYLWNSGSKPIIPVNSLIVFKTLNVVTVQNLNLFPIYSSTILYQHNTLLSCRRHRKALPLATWNVQIVVFIAIVTTAEQAASLITMKQWWCLLYGKLSGDKNIHCMPRYLFVVDGNCCRVICRLDFRHFAVCTVQAAGSRY